MWKIEKLREKNVEHLGKKLSDKNDPNIHGHSAVETFSSQVTRAVHKTNQEHIATSSPFAVAASGRCEPAPRHAGKTGAISTLPVYGGYLTPISLPRLGHTHSGE